MSTIILRRGHGDPVHKLVPARLMGVATGCLPPCAWAAPALVPGNGWHRLTAPLWIRLPVLAGSSAGGDARIPLVRRAAALAA